jgi:hypothetical protein
VSSTNPTNGIKPGTNTEPTTGKKKPEESDFHPKKVEFMLDCNVRFPLVFSRFTPASIFRILRNLITPKAP